MGILRRLKRRFRATGSSTTSYSINVLRCGACETTFESRTAPAHARCPACGSTDIEAASVSVEK